MAGITRREIDELTERARRFGAKGLAYLALEPGGEIKSPIAKFLSDETQRAIIEQTGAAEGDLILIVADAPEVTADVLGRLRVELGDRLGLADPNVLAYVWIHRFPMYQWDAEIGRWHATHNPFSGVLPEDEALLVTASGDPAQPVAGGPGRPCPGAPVRPRAQRLGARRRVDPDPPPRPPRAHRSCSRATRSRAMREKFGAVLDAFEYGAPPHGGIALGIDRWAALLAHQTNIREVMAFPKTQSGTRPDARGAVDRPSPASTRSSACGSSACQAGQDLSGTPERRPRPLDWFAQRPRLAALLGATCISFSGVFYLFAAVSPSTGTFYRAVFGLPLLVLVALGERRRHGPLPRADDPARGHRRASSSPAT